MAIICKPIDADPSTGLPEYSASDTRKSKAALYGGGAYRAFGGRSGFRVDTENTVLAVTATTWTLYPCAAMIDPGINTGMYEWVNTSNLTQTSLPGTPVAPDSTLPRKDIYYIQINDASAGDGSGLRSAPVQYLAGTPNATPSAPTLPVRSLLIATVTVPQTGGGSPTVVLNPARFAAAGAPLPVYSQTERDALAKYDGLIVQRRDQPGIPTETWAGSAWFRFGGDTGWVDLPLINGFTPYTGDGWPGAKYRIRNGWCIIDGAVANAAAWVANTAAAQLPVAARPGVKIQGFNGVIVENTQGYLTIPSGAAGGAFSFSITYPVD